SAPAAWRARRAGNAAAQRRDGRSSLADHVRGAPRAGEGRVHRTSREHEAIPGSEPERAAARREGELAVEDPDALVGSVVMGLVAGVRGIAPDQARKAFCAETRADLRLGGTRRARPGDAL